MNVIYSNRPGISETRTLHPRRLSTGSGANRPPPPGESSTVFSMFDRERYLRDATGLYLIYKDGSRLRIDSSPLSCPSVENPNRTAFGLEDVMIAMCVLLTIAAIGFVTAIAF